MSKSFVFVRGLDRPEKHAFVKLLFDRFNPDNSHVNAALFSLYDVAGADIETRKSAGKTQRNHIKRLLVSGQEGFIIIANESMTPQQWQSFPKMATDLRILGLLVGVNVAFPGKMLNTDEDIRSNLQERNLAAFKSDMTKYYEYKVGSDDAATVARDIVVDLF